MERKMSNNKGHWYVEAPNEWPLPEGTPSVFLAGGITGCPDWASEIREYLSDSGLVLVNPRRSGDQTWDPDISKVQIEWEHRYLRAVERISFWFPKETLCPIALYELGSWTMTDKPIAIGIEPGYLREFDIREQTSLTRPEVQIVDNIPDLAKAIQVA